MILRRNRHSSVSQHNSVASGQKAAGGQFPEIILAKRIRIENAIRLRNADELKALCVNAHGLVEDPLRRRAWPLMISVECSHSTRNRPSFEELRAHRYYQQVLLDVERSIRRFPPSIPKVKRLRLQDKLVSLIMRVLVANSDLHYYQGYHDICVTVLLVLDGDEEVAFRIVESISKTKLRPFMEVSVQGTVKQLDRVYPLLGALNEPLREFLEKSQCGIMFLLPWCITWFSHDLTHYATLVRLFDLFLATEELMPVYLAASLVLTHEEYLLKQECSLSSVHAYLGEILHRIDYAQGEMEERIQFAVDTYRRYPLKRSCIQERCEIIKPKTKKPECIEISNGFDASLDADFVIL